MWPEACATVARAERLNSQFFHIGEAETHQPVWEPPVDILEAHRHVVVIVGLPGVAAESIGVAVDNDALVIVGDRSLPPEFAAAWVHRMELPQGHFERRVPLPRSRYHDVLSNSANGCLYITLTELI